MFQRLKFNNGFALSVSAIFAILVVLLLPSSASALSGSDFKSGRIIDDSVFYNGNSMSSAQIQQFLEAKLPICDTNGTKSYNGTTRASYGTSQGYPPPYTCLKDYRQDINAKNPEDSLCSGMSAASNVRASEIIYRVAQSCGVSPKVLIVLLQKEQSLVTDDWPWSIQYRSATGYGCPDTAPCDAEYYGFFNQVYNAARIYKYYAKYPSSFNHIAGRNNYVLYNPNHSCGGTTVFIENQATAGLYNYTPYQPNATALNNLYGTGDGCSAYGNRNFWRIFNDWFGSTHAPAAVQASGSSAVYLYIQGKKYQVPSMAVLQDHGVHPNSIQTISKAELDGIASPDSGLSSSVGFLVKSESDSDDDGGSVYFISIGKRYKIKNYDQFLRFGFSDAMIKKLPLSYILNFGSGGSLSDFISSVSTNNVFKIESAKKRIIFSASVLNSLNSSSSISRLSDDGLSRISAGDPIHNTGMFFRQANGTVYFFNNEDTTYYLVPNMDVFNCWGINYTGSLPYYQAARSSYIERSSSPISSLSCAIHNTNDGKSYVMYKGKRSTVPPDAGLSFSATNDTVLGEAIMKVSSRGTLSRAIGSQNSNAIWYLEDGVRKLIPNLRNLELLGFNSSSISYVSPSAEAAMPVSSLQKLGTGQIIKSASNNTVYVVFNRSRVAIRSATDFKDFGYSWSDLRTYDETLLDSEYPWTGEYAKRYMKHQFANVIRLIGYDNICYGMNSDHLTAFNVNESAVLSEQHTVAIVPFSKTCYSISPYIKSPDSSTVYYVENGTKHPFRSLQSYLSHNSQKLPVSRLATSTVNSLPTGSAL